MASSTGSTVARLVFGVVLVLVSNLALVNGALRPLSEADKLAASHLYVENADGSFGSLEETYQAVRLLQVLKSSDLQADKTCSWVSGALSSSLKTAQDSFYAIEVAGILHCPQGEELARGVVSRLLAAVKSKNLLELYYSVGALSTIKKHGWSSQTAHFEEAVGDALHSLKALSGSDGMWRYIDSEPESSAKAAGLAFEIAAGVVEITGLDAHRADIAAVKAAVVKLFDNLESYEEGLFYFEESKSDKISGGGGPLAATWAVLRGSAALAGVLPNGLKVGSDKVLGIASFLLSLGIPAKPTEGFYQIDALGILEKNRLTVPLAVVPSSILSVTSNDKLEVAVTTLLGSPPPPATLTLLTSHRSGSDAPPVWSNKKLEPVGDSGKYLFDFLSSKTPVGRYKLRLEVKPETDSTHTFTTGGPVTTFVTVTARISVSKVELAILDGDTGSADSLARLDYGKKDTATLSANHLQKLRLTFELTSPSGGSFKPQQVFVKLRHESQVEHLYLVQSSGKRFELSLDLLGLVEKLRYLSGTYTIELIVGDMTMENPFVWTLANLDLDLPDTPEGKARPPTASDEITSRFGPKPEIAHIFRQPEKRPATYLSSTFLVLTLLPLSGFFLGLLYLGANLKLFPSSGLPVIAALGFHGGVASILLLYFLFWLKLNLFTTLRTLGVLGVITVVPGYYILSHLADYSTKVKAA